MRLTARLHSGLRDVTVRKWNRVWQCRGRFYDYPPFVPQVLKDKGVDIVEMNQQKPELPRWTPPVPDDPRFTEPVPLEGRADWKDVPAYTYHNSTRLFEGMKQACLIAKAVHLKGLPTAVEKLVGRVEIPHRDLLLQRSIMQSQVWNTSESKLRKRFDHRKPSWSFKMEFGITRYNSSLILTKNLLRLCQSQVSQFPSLMNRKQVYQPLLHSYVMYKDVPIIARHPVEFLLTSDSALPPFGDEDLTDATATQTIPDMWPVYPTVDFSQTNNYEFNNVIGFSKDPKFSHPHTIVQIPLHHLWEDTHIQASQLMTCLMFTAAIARQKFGDSIQILPEPVSVQHLAMRESRLVLTFFQLNTLDLDSNTGIKNLVWTCEGENLFEKILGQPWMPRPMKKDRMENFDGSAVDKFLAAYMNGVLELKS